MASKDRVKPESYWKERLSPEAYRVLRQGGTECAFTGQSHGEKRQGSYHCGACDVFLFHSEEKFDSGTGWPSFWAIRNAADLELVRDTSLGMVRTEVKCGHCASHLGHVFDDGPPPSGLRFCINSIALTFVPDEAEAREKDHRT